MDRFTHIDPLLARPVRYNKDFMRAYISVAKYRYSDVLESIDWNMEEYA